MKTPGLSFNWNRARAFLLTAEEGSLSAAARALGLTQSTLGRQVAALEAELGVTLFERGGRSLTLTSAGAEFCDHLRHMGEAADRAAIAAYGDARALEGTVSLAASDVTAAFRLPPILDTLRAEEPGLHIELVVSTAASDLRRREADIAIRHFEPAGPDLVAKKAAQGAARLYASTDYLARLGRPRRPEDLSRADFIGFDGSEAEIAAMNALGLSIGKRNYRIVTTNQLVQWALVKRGLGIGIMGERIGEAEPGVERALPDLPAIPVPVWVVAERGIYGSRRVRTVFDRLVAGLREGATRP
ncbi:MAG: LysR family transcriptional regulator [Alphaproteobacteria bacterium]